MDAHLASHQQTQGKDDARFCVAVSLWPDVGQQLLDDGPISVPLLLQLSPQGFFRSWLLLLLLYVFCFEKLLFRLVLVLRGPLSVSPACWAEG